MWIFHEEVTVGIMVDELQHLAHQSVASIQVSRSLGLRSGTTVVRAGRTRPDQIDVLVGAARVADAARRPQEWV